jgi:hypothetical protein
MRDIKGDAPGKSDLPGRPQALSALANILAIG